MSGNQSQQHQENAVPSADATGASIPSSGTTCTAHGSTGVDGIEEEEQDEPSSFSAANQSRDELASFREQWQRELEIAPASKDGNVNEAAIKSTKALEIQSEALVTENKAKNFFLQGIEHEENGKLYEAIQYYRRAVQLVPDVEFRLYEMSKSKHREYDERDDDVESEEVPADQAMESSSDGEDSVDLMARLQKFFSRSCCVCLPLEEQNATHFSSLPMEIVLYILRWVVSSDLDLRSLELCSQVCRGFYICSRDPEIWRLACARVWGVNCGGLTNYDTWRHMYIERPRLHFNGCYISKTTYVRQGENSFQDQFYRPWHLVEYYRYLRFFPEGLVLMMTTSDDPQASLPQLRQRTSRNSAVMSGRYRLLDNRVVLVLRKQDATSKAAGNNRYRSRKPRETVEVGEQAFHIELLINNYRSRAHAQLAWHDYTITAKRGGQEMSTGMELPTSRYPPFWFSRVKSYAAESETPLQ